ncbi:MAG: ribose 5-phosphate isomerase B [Puniceicoccales bacterium]|jgi:ribose 5-phosphate isomerase B|nr:ribose 5-phosphate isomerase B [Puniceicoccales bacterium]
MTVKLSIGNDHVGHRLALFLIKRLKDSGANILYYGAFSDDKSVDYPDYAQRVADDIAEARSDFGILVCRSGIGMCMAANKVHNVRAANCWNVEISQLSREHNDANVLCIGADFVKMDIACDIVHIFLETKFSGGRHLKRIRKMADLETLARNA